MDNIRKLILTGAGVAAAVLIASSTAHACTTYRGKMTATVTPGAGVSTVIGKNSDTHLYCPTKGPSRVIATAEKIGVPIVAEIIVEPATECPTTERPQNKLKAGVYTIDFRDNAGTPAPAYTGSYTTSWSSVTPDQTSTTTSCGPARIADPGFHRLGTMTVDANGYGVGTATLPASLGKSTGAPVPTDASALCVNNTDGTSAGGPNGDGNQVPLAVI